MIGAAAPAAAAAAAKSELDKVCNIASITRTVTAPIVTAIICFRQTTLAHTFMFGGGDFRSGAMSCFAGLLRAVRLGLQHLVLCQSLPALTVGVADLARRQCLQAARRGAPLGSIGCGIHLHRDLAGR